MINLKFIYINLILSSLMISFTSCNQQPKIEDKKPPTTTSAPKDEKKEESNLTGEKKWKKYPNNPVYEHNTNGAWDVASDPAVIKDGNKYYMIVSGDGGTSSASTEGNSILLATSNNGINWATIPNGQNGVVLTSPAKAWDESMELPELIKANNKFLLFYTGYDPAARDASGGMIWGDLGLAESVDGINYTKVGAPVLKVTPNWYDQDGITDITIVEKNGILHMVYVGWCTQSCTMNNGYPAFYALKATSSDYGHTWTKKGKLDPNNSIGLQHPDLFLDIDGKYSLLYGVDNACAGGKIGIKHAKSDNPLGPFTQVSSTPIFCMGTQAFEHSGKDGAFPSVIVDNGKLKVYYTGIEEATQVYKIGLIEYK